MTPHPSPPPGVHLKQWSGAKVFAATQHLGSSRPSLNPLPPLSEVTGLNSTLNVSNPLMNLNAEQCSKMRCSDKGRCVEHKGFTACACSLGYSGDSCQDHLLKTMIIYSAAGLFAGIVVIALIAVAVKRKNGAKLRFVCWIDENRANNDLPLHPKKWMVVMEKVYRFNHLSTIMCCVMAALSTVVTWCI